MSVRFFSTIFYTAAVAVLSFAARADTYACQVEYIESDGGNSYVNTGVAVNNGHTYTLELDVEFTNSGCWNGANGRLQYQTQSADAGARHVFRFEVTGGGEETVTRDGVNIYNRSWGSNYSGNNIFILAMGDGSNANWKGQKGKVYSAKIYEDGVLVRDFIPVTSTSNAYGLFDLLSQTFYGSAGSAFAKAGPSLGGGGGSPLLSLGAPVALRNVTVRIPVSVTAFGGDCTSATLGVAYGPTGGDTVTTNWFGSVADHDEHAYVLAGLSPLTPYDFTAVATNALGKASQSPTFTLVTSSLPVDESWNYASRDIVISATNKTAGTIISLDLVFGPDKGTAASHALYVLYGPTPSGAEPELWEHVEKLADIPSATSSYHYTMPAGWGDAVRAVRFAFDLADVAPYDCVSDSLASSGIYIDTGFAAYATETGGIEAECDMKWASIPNDGCFLGCCTDNKRCYLVYSYPSKWNLGFGSYNANDGFSPLPNERYLVRAVYHGNEQSIVVNGLTVVSRTYSAVLSPGNLGLFRCNYNGAGQYSAYGTLYSLKLYEDGVIARDFVPCVLNGVAGIYDRVTGVVRLATGSGAAIGADLGRPQYVSYSPTLRAQVQSDMPAVDSYAYVSDDGLTASFSGVLSSFGGDRSDCKVRVFVGSSNDVAAMTDATSSFTVGEDGSFGVTASRLTPDTDYYWLLEVEGGSGNSVRTLPLAMTTHGRAVLSSVRIVSVEGATVRVEGGQSKPGVGPTTVILRAGSTKESAVVRDSKVLSGDYEAFTLTWVGCETGVDWSVSQYWEVLAVVSCGDEMLTNAYGRTTFQLNDTTTYTWTGAGAADVDGRRRWNDAANWSPSAASSNQAGYPVSRSTAVFPSGVAAETILLESMLPIGTVRLESTESEIVLMGTSSTGFEKYVAAERYPEFDLTRGCVLVFDGISVTVKDQIVGSNACLRVRNGAVLSVGQMFYVRGAGAVLEISSGAKVAVNNWGTGGLAPYSDGTVIVDDATIEGYAYWDAGKGPCTYRFQGRHPLLKSPNYVRAWNDVTQDKGRSVIEFVIPEGGFAEPPIQAPNSFGGEDDRIYCEGVMLRVDRRSPVFRTTKVLTNVLVSAGSVNPNRVTFTESKPKTAWLYDPVPPATPKKIVFVVPRVPGLVITLL